MNQTTLVRSTPQKQPEAMAPAQNSDRTEVLPSTTTDTGAELALAEPVSGMQSSRSPLLSEDAGGDSTPGLYGQSNGQPAAASMLNTSVDDEAEITTLAYRYYEEEGYPEGRALEHWARAEQEVRGKRGR